MLENGFYTITDLKIEGEKAEVKIALNPEHAIYKGHFPGNPVTPGVCQLQIVKELLTMILDTPCHLVEAKSIKFTNILTPYAEGLSIRLEFSRQTSNLGVSAILYSGEKVYLKLSATYRVNKTD